METSLVMNALQVALHQRQPQRQLTHHSDRGSQYASTAYREALKQQGIEASMSRKGNCWDNAVAKSFFGGLKKEFIHDVKFKTRKQAKAAIFEWIEVFYSRQRLHSKLVLMAA